MSTTNTPTTALGKPSHEGTDQAPYLCTCHANSDVDGNVPYCPHKYEDDDEPCHETGHLNGLITCTRCSYRSYW